MLNPRVREERAGLSRITDRDLNRFANCLYGYLYYKIRLTHSNQYRSPHFEKVIGKAVLRVQNSVRDFNRTYLDKFRFCFSKESLCQQICDLYPDTDYFKKFLFVSAFILELVSYWHEGEELRDFSLGPTLFQAMFRTNFEDEFENKRGWRGLLQAATFFHQVPMSGVFLREHLLPATLEGVVSRVRGLHPNPEQADVDEVAALIERTHVGSPKKSGLVGNVEGNLPGPSGLGRNVFQCETIASLERLQAGQMEDNQQGKVAKVEELKEANQPEALPSTSRLGGNVAQTGRLGESSSEKPEEDVLQKRGDRHLRKRSRDAPSKTDSGEKLDSPILSKAMKEEGDGDGNLEEGDGDSHLEEGDDDENLEEGDGDRNVGKRKHDSPPKSDSDGESEGVSPSKAKVGKKIKAALDNRGNP